MTESRRAREFMSDLLLLGAGLTGLYVIVRYAFANISQLDPDSEKNSEARRKSAAVLRKLGNDTEGGTGNDKTNSLGRDRRENLALNQYERVIASDLVVPEDIPVSFSDIGGLDDIIDELRESVIYPLTMPHLYSRTSPLLSAPSGVLLHGPPGCGKTMLAKALAHESGAFFINLHISTVTEKWYGDSNKLVNAVFSLARKLQPSIVFIDEIDAVLGTRRSGEHEASGMVKAEFMTLWDGLTSSNTAGEPQRICILGATNRIHDIDEAILRRMPKKFPVRLPSAIQRRRILNLILKDTRIDREGFDENLLVSITDGLSGSDIKELCRDAAMIPVRDLIRAKKSLGESLAGIEANELRGLQTRDFFGRVRTHSAESSTIANTTERKEASTSSSEYETDDGAIEKPD
ncbi:MAG: hypothetical protein M1814_004293 [Vezdaea aestivalis]|nr:MAG: hypothetical protein M1814_004293 [Vezdaea aestivalis]